MLEFMGLIVGISLVFGVILFLLAKKTDTRHQEPLIQHNTVEKETDKAPYHPKTELTSQVERDYATTLEGNVVQDPTKVPVTPSDYQHMISNATPLERARIENEMLYNPLHTKNSSHKTPIHYDDAIHEEDEHEQEMYLQQEQQRMFEEQQWAEQEQKRELEMEEQRREEQRLFEEQQEYQRQQDEEAYYNQQQNFDENRDY